MADSRLIVLEGIDGSGTTTQVDRLAHRLRGIGARVHTTCEPSHGPIGQLIRRALQGRLAEREGLPSHELGWAAMALLFAADRADHVESEIRPALEKGQIVLSDRYDLSSLAYQSATSPEGVSSVAWIRTLNGQVPRPSLTIVIDLAPELAEARRKVRGEPEELFERRDLQQRLAAIYARAEELVPEDRLVHVAGEGTADEVSERIWGVAQGLERGFPARNAN